MKLFMPAVFGNAAQTETIELLELIQEHEEQKRTILIINPLLMQVAQARVQDMADRDYFAHVDLDGHYPNWHVRQSGYVLPDYYLDNKNNVESIAAGQTNAEIALDGWMRSESHRKHVLGLDPFFAGQIYVGVGYAKKAGTYYTRYWSFVSAP